MTDEKKGAKRNYMVLKQVLPGAETDPALIDRTPIDGAWVEVGTFEATSEQQALTLAIGGSPDAAGAYVAISRWKPRTVAVKPVTQTRLEWS